MVWVIGCNGMIGTEVCKILGQKNIPWIGSDKEVDITVPTDLESFAHSHDKSANMTGYTIAKKIVPGKISWVVNCAAYTNVLAAENMDETDESYVDVSSINRDGAVNVARVARHIGAKLIHLSTGCVYDGNRRQPHTEDSQKIPCSVYANTKLDGENAIQKEMTQYYILRSSWVYGSGGNNFVKTLVNDMRLKDSIPMASDMAGSPTSSESLAAVICRIIETSQNATSLFGKKSALPYGIYNYADLGAVTRLDFAKKVQELAKKYKLVNGKCGFDLTASKDMETERLLPSYLVLDSSKIYSGLKMKPQNWDVALDRFFKTAIQSASL